MEFAAAGRTVAAAAVGVETAAAVRTAVRTAAVAVAVAVGAAADSVPACAAVPEGDNLLGRLVAVLVVRVEILLLVLGLLWQTRLSQ